MNQKTGKARKTQRRELAKYRQAIPPLGEALVEFESASPAGVNRSSALLAVIAVLVFLAIVRLRIADVPLERDEGEYAYAGQLILEGIPPFELVYNMKLPGIYYAFSVILTIFGQTSWGIHVGLLCVNAATVLILFFLARRLLHDSMAAAVAASAFGVLTLDRWILGVFAHATHFVVLAAIAGLLVLLHGLEKNKKLHYVVAGVLLGTSVLMKQNGIFFLALGIGIALWNGARRAGALRSGMFHAVLLVAGSAIPFVLLLTVFLAQGVFDKFWFWTIQYGTQYISETPVSLAWTLFGSTLADVTQADRAIWILAAVGVAALWAVPWAVETRVLLMGLLAASLMAICPGLYFRQHYFILLLPVVGLFVGVAALSLARLVGYYASSRVARLVSVSVFVASVGIYTYNEWRYLFSMPTNELSRTRYGTNPFVEAPEIARYIQARTAANDRIAVLGSEPEIYFYANRKSSTGYIYTYPLTEQQKYSARMQDEMIDEISSHHPKYLVFVRVVASWLPRSSNERILQWSDRYIKKCYDLVGIADIQRPEPTRFAWDAEAVGYQPRSTETVYTFRSTGDAACVAAP